MWVFPVQDLLRSVFQWSVQTFVSTGEAGRIQSKCTGSPQPGWVLQLPINGSTPLDAALEQYFFAKDLLAEDGGVLGQESARLCRLPATFVIALKRAAKVKLVVDMCIFLTNQCKVTEPACSSLPELQLCLFCSGCLHPDSDTCVGIHP